MPDVVTIEQVRGLLKSEKLKPSDLFEVDVLVADPVVVGFMSTRIKEATAGEYAHRKREEEASQKAKQELEEKLKQRDTELGKLRLDSAKQQVGTLFEKERAARKLNERQAKFVKLRLDKFAPKAPESVEADLKAYLDAEVDEYAKLAKELGIDAQPAGGTPRAGAEPGPGEGGGAEGDEKYLNPSTNPMIKTT